MGSLNLSYPQMSGQTLGEQVQQLYSYLYQVTDELNAADWSAKAVLSEMTMAATVMTNPALQEQETAGQLKEYAAIRDLIVKNAYFAGGVSQELVTELAGEYVAISDFGTFQERVNSTLIQTGKYINQLYEYTAGIRAGDDMEDVNQRPGKADVAVQVQSYIKTGLLYYDAGTGGLVPVYGLGVGRLQTTVAANGEKVLDRDGVLTTYEADRIVFWGSEDGPATDGCGMVAMISPEEVYFPRARITAYSGFIGGDYERDPVTGEWKTDPVTGERLLIDGWTIGTGKLYSTHGGVEGGAVNFVALSSNTEYAIWAGDAAAVSAPFWVKHDGSMKASSADITGRITADEGRIGPWYIEADSLYWLGEDYTEGDPHWYNPDTMYMGTSGISLSDVFYVDRLGNGLFKGVVQAQNIKDPDGTSMLVGQTNPVTGEWSAGTNDGDGYQFKWQYLYLYGLTILNPDQTSPLYNQPMLVIDGTTGNVTTRGTIYADDGYFGYWYDTSGAVPVLHPGWYIGPGLLYSSAGLVWDETTQQLVPGGYIGMSAEGEYALWAGDSTAGGARFWVKHDGSMYAQDGIFEGTIQGGTIDIADDGGTVVGHIYTSSSTSFPLVDAMRFYAVSGLELHAALGAVYIKTDSPVNGYVSINPAAGFDTYINSDVEILGDIKQSGITRQFGVFAWLDDIEQRLRANGI